MLHVPGESLTPSADALSHYHTGTSYQDIVHQMVENGVKIVSLPPHLFQLSRLIEFSSIPGLDLTLPQLRSATHALVRKAFRSGITQNHLRQAQYFIDFCHHYQLQLLLPAIPSV